MSNYSLPANDSHFISLETAAAMTNLYQQNRDAILLPEYRELNLLCLSETFNLQDILTLLAQTGTAGLRIYYGMKEDFTVHAILLAVNSNGKDIKAVAAANDDPLILEEGQRCPPVCNDDSLNS